MIIVIGECVIKMSERMFKMFKGKSWNIAVDAQRYLLESMGIEKEYTVVIRIEEL